MYKCYHPMMLQYIKALPGGEDNDLEALSEFDIRTGTFNARITRNILPISIGFDHIGCDL